VWKGPEGGCEDKGFNQGLTSGDRFVDVYDDGMISGVYSPAIIRLIGISKVC
jgi:hypothetical protein